MKVLITDADYPDVQLEQKLYQDAGIECVMAQCRTEEDVLAASAGCFGLLVAATADGGGQSFRGAAGDPRCEPVRRGRRYAVHGGGQAPRRVDYQLAGLWCR